jgi:hypothetical protein
MIRGFMTTVAVVGLVLAAAGAFYDQSRRADATTTGADFAPAAVKGDRLAVAAPADSAALQNAVAGSETRILRAHNMVFAENARSRFMTIALPGGQHTTVLARVPVTP